MASESSLRGSISQLNTQITNQENRNAELSRQIERLRQAKAEVLNIYNDDQSFFTWVDNYDVGPTWQGERREEFEESKRSAKSSGDSYCERIAEIYGSMGAKITQLEQELLRGQGSVFQMNASVGYYRYLLLFAKD